MYRRRICPWDLRSPPGLAGVAGRIQVDEVYGVGVDAAWDGEVVAGVEIVTGGPYPSALVQPDSYRHPVNSSAV